MNKILYHAYFVDDVEALKKQFPPVHKNLFYHHQTIAFKPEYGVESIGVGYTWMLKAYGRLTTDKVDCLLMEDSSLLSHITLSTADGVPPSACRDEIINNVQKIKFFFRVNVPATEGYFDGDVVTVPKSVLVKR